MLYTTFSCRYDYTINFKSKKLQLWYLGCACHVYNKIEDSYNLKFVTILYIVDTNSLM